MLDNLLISQSIIFVIHPINLKKVTSSLQSLQKLLLLWLLSKIGIAHTTGETNAQATVNKAIAYLDSIGMAYADHTIDDVSVIQETIKLMKDEGCQAVFVANDNKLASHGNMAILGGACLENGLPLYCAADSQVEVGITLPADITSSANFIEVRPTN